MKNRLFKYSYRGPLAEEDEGDFFAPIIRGYVVASCMATAVVLLNKVEVFPTEIVELDDIDQVVVSDDAQLS